MKLVRPHPHQNTPSGVPIFNLSPLVRRAPDGVLYAFNARVHRCSVKAGRPCGRLYAPDKWVGWSIVRFPNSLPVAGGDVRTVAQGRAFYDAITRPKKLRRVAA